jgi:hypothetical protein
MEIIIICGVSSVFGLYMVYDYLNGDLSRKIKRLENDKQRYSDSFDQLRIKYNNAVDNYNSNVSRIIDLRSKLTTANSRIRQANHRIEDLKRLGNGQQQRGSDLPFTNDLALFGLTPDYDLSMLKKRYRQLSSFYHGDKTGSKDDRIMKAVNTAYTNLSKKFD